MIQQIMKMIKAGQTEESMFIRSALSIGCFEEVLEIAKARLKNTKTSQKRLFLTREDHRFATPEIVADYRAERLACDVIFDLCCGIGLQSISFARTCKKVYGIEIDERKVRYARQNATALGLKNIEFICADALSDEMVRLAKESKAQIIFCDPKRPAQQEERRFEDIQPDIKVLVDRYQTVTDKICIELPPFLDRKDIPFDGEMEYIGVDGTLNRMQLYLGGLRKHKVSAVSLPCTEAIYSEMPPQSLRAPSPGRPDAFIFETDTTIIRAGLATELIKQSGLRLWKSTKRALLLTSDHASPSPFIKERYQVLETVENSQEKILESLKRNDAEKVVLRASVEPERYWDIRRGYEATLTGRTVIHLFIEQDMAVLCKKFE